MGSGRALKRALGGGDRGRLQRLLRPVLKVLSVVALSALLFQLVSIYRDALRDPRYLDGWLLAGGIALQLYFHIAVAAKRLSPMAAAQWRQVHILVGYLLVPAFILHSDFSLPDTGFEWALWASFVAISLSGIFGIVITWLLRSADISGGGARADRISANRAKLARDVHAIVAMAHPASALTALPPPPYDAWIDELYRDWLEGYFSEQPGFFSRHFGSRYRLRQIMEEIGRLSSYVDGPAQKKLDFIKTLVAEKDRLDAADVALGLSRAWLLVHVPAAYMMVVLTVVHVLVVYAFSSGSW